MNGTIRDAVPAGAVRVRGERTAGTTVYGFDGAKVGEVVAVRPTSVVVEKGFLCPLHYDIPTSAIGTYDDGKVYLTVTKYQALHCGWDLTPAGNRPAPRSGGALAAVTSAPGEYADGHRP